jgi:hypothetical protein
VTDRDRDLLLRLHAALGGGAGRVLSAGIVIGVGLRSGGRTRYARPDGTALGYVERLGEETVLRDPAGRTVCRFRIQRAV